MVILRNIERYLWDANSKLFNFLLLRQRCWKTRPQENLSLLARYWIHWPLTSVKFELCLNYLPDLPSFVYSLSLWITSLFLTNISDNQRNKDKREQYKKVKAHVRQDDGRVQAYGWSLPAKLPSPPKGPSQQPSNLVGVPVPVFCRPLAEKELGTKVRDMVFFLRNFPARHELLSKTVQSVIHLTL